MLDGLTTDMGARFLLAAGGVGLGLFVLVGILVFLRRRNSALFVRGGKNREPRLMVLDAAAVDSKRRLVLIRRDNVEHLVMIGGPTDIVIESGIGALKAAAEAREVQPQAAVIPEVPILRPEPAPVQAAEIRIAAEQRLPARAPAAAETRTPVQMPIQPQPAIDSPRPEMRPMARAPEPELAAPRPPPVAQPVPTGDSAPRNAPGRDVSAAAQVLYGETPAPDIRPERSMAAETPAQPVEPMLTGSRTTAPEPAATSPGRAQPLAASAEDILDAARGRVLQPSRSDLQPQGVTRAETPERIEPSFAQAPASAASRVILPSHVTSPAPGQMRRDELAEEFEKILDAEMAAGGILLDDDLAPPAIENRPGTTPSMPIRPNPAQPPVTGATPENSLEKEMARMLGEMSVKRPS
jgi:hypothetical protein